MNIHLVFHVSLLDVAVDDGYSGQKQIPLPTVIVYREEEYEVEEVRNYSIQWRRLEYLVK